ncbi:hypothetical protein LIER_10574 [Lithospermum erythrorhizon]|uniref:Uncharacterized protein n=1 Tax=Lithospermum erythrorhizon TaxID=34254 RepID=A0AAV3PPT2_LITER
MRAWTRGRGKKITSLCTSFLWGGSKKAKVKYEDICAPNDEGGLGLKDVQTWNFALLASALRSLHSGELAL